MFSDLYCLLYDKLNRPELYLSLKNLTIYESKDIKDKQIKDKLLKFEVTHSQINVMDFEELYYLKFHDNILYERILGVTALLMSGFNIFVLKSYLKKNLYTKYFIFIDNNRFFANHLMALENSLNRFYLTSFLMFPLFGTYMIVKSYFTSKFLILPSEQTLRKKYKRDLLIYNNLKFSFI